MIANTSDQELVSQINGSAAARDNALQLFFRDKGLKVMVLNHARTHGGTDDDGKDLFQDTVVLFDRNIRSGKYQGQSSLRTYFFAIAKWHWLNMRRKKAFNHEPLSDDIHPGFADGPELKVIDDERKSILNKALDMVGGRCTTLLNLYKLSYSMDEISREAGLSSADMAKKEVYRCRERLRNYLFSQPDILNLLR